MRPDVWTKFGRATGLPSLRSQSCEISSDFSMTEDRGVSVVGASFVFSHFLCLSRSEKILSNIFSSRTVKKKGNIRAAFLRTRRCLTEDVWAYSFMNSWYYLTNQLYNGRKSWFQLDRTACRLFVHRLRRNASNRVREIWQNQQTG